MKKDKLKNLAKALKKNLSRRKATAKKKSSSVKTLFLLSFMFLASCHNQIHKHGYNVEDKNIKEFVVNKTTINQVIDIVGEPTVKESDKTFLYLWQEYQQKIFFDPKLTDQRVMQLTFNKKDVLSSIKIYTTKNVRHFKYDKDQVVFDGKKLSFFDQMISNISMFNSKAGRGAK